MTIRNKLARILRRQGYSKRTIRKLLALGLNERKEIYANQQTTKPK